MDPNLHDLLLFFFFKLGHLIGPFAKNIILVNKKNWSYNCMTAEQVRKTQNTKTAPYFCQW